MLPRPLLSPGPSMLDIVIVCTIIAAAMVLFVSEKIRIDLVALSIMAVLMVVGALRPPCSTLNLR